MRCRSRNNSAVDVASFSACVAVQPRIGRIIAAISFNPVIVTAPSNAIGSTARYPRAASHVRACRSRDLGNRVMLRAVNVTGLCRSLGLGNSASARAISVSQKVRTRLRYAACPGKLLRLTAWPAASTG